jgi:hypothetical protein
LTGIKKAETTSPDCMEVRMTRFNFCLGFFVLALFAISPQAYATKRKPAKKSRWQYLDHSFAQLDVEISELEAEVQAAIAEIEADIESDEESAVADSDSAIEIDSDTDTEANHDANSVDDLSESEDDDVEPAVQNNPHQDQTTAEEYSVPQKLRRLIQRLQIMRGQPTPRMQAQLQALLNQNQGLSDASRNTLLRLFQIPQEVAPQPAQEQIRRFRARTEERNETSTQNHAQAAETMFRLPGLGGSRAR